LGAQNFAANNFNHPSGQKFVKNSFALFPAVHHLFHPQLFQVATEAQAVVTANGSAAGWAPPLLSL
jgi:hypothetical protein